MYTVTITASPNGSVSIQDPNGLDGIFSYTLNAGESRVVQYTTSQFDHLKPILDTLVSAGFLTYSYTDGSSDELVNNSVVAGATITDALNTLSAGSGGTRFGWTYKTAILDADPGVGNFRLNNLDPTLATFIYISELTSEGIDVSTILAELRKNVEVSIDQTGPSEAMTLYTCSGTPTDATTYYKIPVTYVDRGPDPLVGDSLCDIEFVMAFAHKLGGELHEADTLANLNSKITDAVLDDAGDARTPLAHAPSHAGGTDALTPGDIGAEPEITPKGTAFNVDFGTTGGTACEGDDARLSDDRTPLAHALSHAGGTDALTPGDIGAEPEITPKGTAFNVDFGTTGGTACEGDDSRLSDDRTPLAHALSHAGGTDALTPGDIGAEPEITPKGTAFNKDFGTTAGTVCEGNFATDVAGLTSSIDGFVELIESRLEQPYTVRHTDTAAASLNTAIAALVDGDILEVDPPTVTVYDPITIPANVGLVIRAAWGKTIQLTGTGCIKLMNGARDTIIAGVSIQNAASGAANYLGAGITFGEHQAIVENITFYDVTIDTVSSGSGVMCSYHWSVGGDFYYTANTPAECSTGVNFIKCNFYDATTDATEGAAVVLRGCNDSRIVENSAIDDTAAMRGFLLQNCVDSYFVRNYVRMAGTVGGNCEGIKLDEIGTCSYASSSYIINNIVEGCTEGIDVDDTVGAHVYGNTCINCVEEGISVDGGSAPDIGIAILVRNLCYNTRGTGTSAGILAELGSVTEMYGNNCFGNTVDYRILNGYSLPASNISDPDYAQGRSTANNVPYSGSIPSVYTAKAALDALYSYVQNNVADAVIVVPDVGGGGTTAAMTVTLKDLDGTTLVKDGVVKIICATSQYGGSETMDATATFSLATTGSILESGNGWCVAQCDDGIFACTVTRGALGGTAYFSVSSVDGGVITPSSNGIVVRGCVPDAATWS